MYFTETLYYKLLANIITATLTMFANKLTHNDVTNKLSKSSEGKNMITKL